MSESAPTFPTGIRGAVVAINDSVNAGRSAITDAYGFYTIADLQSAGMTIAVSADGFVGTSRGLEATSNTTANFELPPVPEQMTLTLTGDIASRDGTCSDGVSNKPCRIVVIPIHHPGPIDAMLTWKPSVADLDLTLFRTDDPTPIVRSASTNSKEERVRADLTVAATYELRLTYAGGTGDTKYTLKITHLN